MKIDRNALGIFVIHKLLVELGKSICIRLDIDHNFSIYILLITIITVLISCTGVVIIDYFAPILLGKQYRY